MASIFFVGFKKSNSSINANYERKSTRTFLVMASTDADENFVRINLSYGGSPIGIYSLHPTDNRQLVMGISVEMATETKGRFFNPTNASDPNNGTDCLVWTASVEYGPWNPLEHTDTGNPTDQPVGVFFEGVTAKEIVDVDMNGNPIVNSAGDYFDPPIERDRTTPIIKIVRNEVSFSDSTILAFADKLNSDTFYGYAPKTLKIGSVIGEQLFSQSSGEEYFRVTYQLHYNPDTWKSKPLDQGYRRLVTTGGVTTQQQILAAGVPITSPALLNGSGQPITLPATSSDVVVLSFDIYQMIPFTSTFGFPAGLLN